MKKTVWAVCLLFLVTGSSLFAEELFDTRAADERFNAGLKLYFKKDYENAIRIFREAANINPDDAKSYYFIAYSYYELKDVDKAMGVFQETYDLDPDYSPLAGAAFEPMESGTE